MRLGSKILIVAAAAIVVFAAAVLVGYRVLTRTIQTRLLAALGPEAELGSVEVGLRDVTVNNLRIRGKGGQDLLALERIVVTPSLKSLLTDQVRLSRIELERPAALVTIRRDGSVQLPLGLPANGRGMAAGGQAVQVAIAQVQVHDGRIDLIDQTVPGPPVRLRVEQVNASLMDLSIPLKTERSRLEFEGVIRGRQAEGRVRISGWVEPVTQSASVKATLRSIDLTLLAPYLLKVQEATVEHGTLDMDLDFQVRQRRVNAPGMATLRDLQLGSSPGVLNTFLGVPRQAVVNLLKTQEGKIETAFVVEGDLSDPKFSLQRSLVVALTQGLAEQLGVSLKGVGSGVVELGKKGTEALGGAAKGLGQGLKGLFEKKP